jgi:tetratricopeptide repeat protein
LRKLLAVLLFPLLGTWTGPASAATATAVRLDRLTYLILPYENRGGDPSLDWLSGGLALSLGEHLRGLGSRVIEEEDVSQLMEEAGIPPGAVPTLASALEIGRKVRARPDSGRPDRLILGRYDVQDGQITVAVRWIDLAKVKGGPWMTRTGRLAGLLEVHQGLAVAFAREQGLATTGPRAEALKAQLAGVPLLAFETYSRAMGESDPSSRLRLLRRAAHEFPGYPAATYQAAALLARQEHWDEAAAMLERAAAPPAQDEHGFYLLSAAVALERDDPPAAVGNARLALEQSDTPRARLLLGRALLASGDHDQARAELKKITSLDPSDPELQELRRAVGEASPAGAGTP